MATTTPPKKALVIVESPTKARTIRKFLGEGFQVEASMGHIRDLPGSASELPVAIKGQPWARLAVNVDEGFQPIYVVPPDKKKTVTELKRALKDADVLYIATDEDREGESIGWHLYEVLKPKIPTHRMVFHEITKEAIAAALNAPRALDLQLVKAQEARRVIDRLVGYVVSPLLWKKVGRGLSAGRVQSVAVRLLVERERERMAFTVAEFWRLRGVFGGDEADFGAQMATLGGLSIASGKDFDDETGLLKAGRTVHRLMAEEAQDLARRLEGAEARVAHLDQKEFTRQPYPPFTTSTLQQEANRKLGLSASQTMRIAQRLYESGHITYMRTDSVNLAQSAVSGIRGMIQQRYGANSLSAKPRTFSTKSKGAQEAHEAIRPAGTSMATWTELGLEGQEGRLYELIWKRTVATQMRAAKLASTNVTLSVEDAEAGALTFRTSGRQILEPGFFRVYVEGADDPEAKLDDQSVPLPALEVGMKLQLRVAEALATSTRPPARYSEATLVKMLEKQGIGRPSTYASIIDTIQRRGYVRGGGRQLTPTFTAIAVTQLLEQTLPKVVDVEFTAGMEGWLDQITTGADRDAYLKAFYEDELIASVTRGEAEVEARAICTISAKRAAPYTVRVGRYGPFVEVGEGEQRRGVSLPPEVAPSDVDAEFIKDLLERAERGEVPLGEHPEHKLPIFVRVGRFGPYVQMGEATDENPKPQRQSLPPGLDASDVDLDKAIALLSLPRLLGHHPEDEVEIRASIGRYGPYVVHGKVYASLKKTDDVLTVDLARALELLAEKAKGSKKAEPLRTIGEHPEDGEPVVIFEGRYGPYVKHAKINASLPKDVTVEALTMAQALELLAARAAKKKGRKATTTSTKKPAAKKATAKKATSKKPAAKKAEAPEEAPAAEKKAAPAKKKPRRKAAAKKTAEEKAAPKKKKAPKKEATPKAEAKPAEPAPDAKPAPVKPRVRKRKATE